MSEPKRVSKPPGSYGAPRTVSGSSFRPANVRDAMTEAHAVAGGALGRPSTGPASAPAIRKVVMLVDPDAALRAKLRSGLEAHYDIIEANDGLEAVELAIKLPHPPAMIVCEVTMPRLDGFAFAKMVRGNPLLKKVHIMFVTTRNSPQDVTQALVIGVSQYVHKTTPTAQIVDKIRKIVV
jgi:CheY-like chemotaxis protein